MYSRAQRRNRRTPQEYDLLCQSIIANHVIIDTITDHLDLHCLTVLARVDSRFYEYAAKALYCSTWDDFLYDVTANGNAYLPPWAVYTRCLTISDHDTKYCEHRATLNLPNVRMLRIELFGINEIFSSKEDAKRARAACASYDHLSRGTVHRSMAKPCPIVKSLRPSVVVLQAFAPGYRTQGFVSGVRPLHLPSSVRKVVSINDPKVELCGYDYQLLFSHCPATLQEIVIVYHVPTDPTLEQPSTFILGEDKERILPGQNIRVPYPSYRTYRSKLEIIAVICARIPCKVTIALQCTDDSTTTPPPILRPAHREIQVIADLEAMVEKETAVTNTLRGRRGVLSKSAWRRLDQRGRIRIMILSEYRRIPFVVEELEG